MSNLADLSGATGTISVVILIVLIAIACVVNRKGRRVPRLMADVMLFMIMYLVVKLLHGLLLWIATLPWLAAILLSVVVLYAVLLRGAMNFLASALEGCDNPRARFTGEGSSAGYRYGNFFLSVMVGIGALGMANFAPIGELWVFISTVIGCVFCLIAHAADKHNYGNEPAGEPKSSDSTPTKLYHDFMAQGVFVALYLMTWVPTLLFTVWAITTGQSVDYLPAVAIIITALIMAVVLAVKHDDIDYAKIHPAPTK